ncbi:MAG: phosphoribosyltransferase [bacterium]
MIILFAGRWEAGLFLGEFLRRENINTATLFAIPSGGIPVAMAVCTKISAKMDILVVKKLRLPYSPETGFGAVAFDGTIYLNERIVSKQTFATSEYHEIYEQTKREAILLNEQLRGSQHYPEKVNEPLVVVDDGLATGYTILAGARSLQKLYPNSSIAIAAPVSPRDTFALLQSEFPRIYVPHISDDPFFAVGNYYVDFHQISLSELQSLLTTCQNMGILLSG